MDRERYSSSTSKDTLKEYMSCAVQQFLKGKNKLTFLVIVETVLSQVRKFLSERKQCEGMRDDFSTQSSVGETAPCGFVLEYTQVAQE